MKETSLSSEEVERFLLVGRIIRMATVRKDGTPHLVPIWYLYQDGKIYMHTYHKSQKVNNIRRNPVVALCLDVGDNYYDMKNLKLRGKAKILENNEKAQEIAEKILTKYLGSPSHPQAKLYLSEEAQNIVLEVESFGKMHSENFSKERTATGAPWLDH